MCTYGMFQIRTNNDKKTSLQIGCVAHLVSSEYVLNIITSYEKRY